jgi:predicted ATPase/DNA-binding SARP family transcriptional activator
MCWTPTRLTIAPCASLDALLIALDAPLIDGQAAVVDRQAALRIAVLGPCVVERAGRDVTPSSALQRRLLTLLALRSPRTVSVESLMDVAWPRTERPRDPRQNLHTHMSRLRRHLDEGTDDSSAIITEADGYRLDPEVATSDLRELSTLTSAGTAADGAMTTEHLERALALWRGPSLIAIVDSDDGVAEATRLDELRLSLREVRFEQLLAGRPDVGLVAELEAFTIDHPYRERPHAVLMEALYHLGRQADALSTYQRLRTRLGEDLGLEPSVALRQLESQILGHQLAEHHPEPTAVVAERQAVPPGAMRPPPKALTALVGRAAELAQLRAAVKRSRLVTIVGAGGVGKTRIAIELADELDSADAHRPVVWCDLAATMSASDVIDVVALALHVHRQGRQTAHDAVMSAVTGMEPVLILDNCEQVAEAVADLIADVLAAAGSRVVTTARAPLDVPGEQLVQLSPMSWRQSATSNEPPPAVALFCERATAAGADLGADARTGHLLAAVCCAVDGLPLGIELAAAQLRNMTLEELAEQVTASSGALDLGRRSGAERHRSIRSALEWSLDSLDDADREVFTCISVFSGSFGVHAAATVVESDDEADVASRLRSLTDLSLVTVDTVSGRSRFRLLRTARLIGQERAETNGSATVLADRHRRWVLDLLQNNEPLFRGPAEAEAVRSIELELDNIRAVVRRAADESDPETALTVVASLSDFGIHRMRDDMGDWAELALTLDGADDHPLRASAMATIAFLATSRGDLATAESLARRVLDMRGVPIDAALHAHHASALVALYSGALPEAVEAARRQLRLAESVGDPFNGQFACMLSGLSELYGGASDRAMQWADRSQELARRSGSPTSAAWADYFLAEVLAKSDPVRSASLLRSAIRAGDSVNNELVTGVARLSITTLPFQVGHEKGVLEAYRQIIHSWRSRNHWTHQWTTLQNLAPVLARCGADADATILLGALTTDERLPHLFGDTAEKLAVLREDLVGRIGEDRLEALRSSGAAQSPPETLQQALAAIDGLLAASA